MWCSTYNCCAILVLPLICLLSLLIRQYQSLIHYSYTAVFDTYRIETENSRAAAAAASRGVAEDVKAPIGFIEVSTALIIIYLPVLLSLVIYVVTAAEQHVIFFSMSPHTKKK
jgi:hypothetical protein